MGANEFRRSIFVVVAGKNAGLAEKLREHSDQVCILASPATLDDLHSAIREYKPEVALITTAWGDGQNDCLAAIRDLAGSLSNTRPALVLEVRDAEFILKAFAAGARGVVYADESGETICAAVQAIARGRLYVGPEELQLLLASMAKSPGTADVKRR